MYSCHRIYHLTFILSRHLAEKWSTSYITPNTKRRLTVAATELSTIEHLILLDLLGAKNPAIQSFFLDTAWLFDAMAAAEQRLHSTGALNVAGTNEWRSFFVPRREGMTNRGYIEDDHIPFMKRGVSVLHIIASPFPRVWHTIKVRFD